MYIYEVSTYQFSETYYFFTQKVKTQRIQLNSGILIIVQDQYTIKWF